MFICIEGNIGSGKSTIAKALAHKLKADYLPEQFEENTLLPLFYKDPKTFAFPTEYSFLIERQKQLVNYAKVSKNIPVTISDFHFDKCVCFAKTNLTNEDFLFYKKHFKAIKKTIPQPDLIVYLDVKVDLLIQNINKRGRKMERNLKKSYLQKLKKSLDKYYVRKKNKPILIIPIIQYTSHTVADCCHKITEAITQHKIKN